MKRPIYEILFRPDAVFEELMQEKESLKIPALIILVGGVVAAAYGYLIGSLTGKLLAGIMPGMEGLIALFSVIGALIGPFIFWIIWAGAIHLISTIFKGEGSFTRVMEVIGYGYIPQIFGTLISLVISFNYVGKVQVPSLSSAAAEDPQLIQDAVQALMHDPAMMEMTQIAAIVGMVFLLWSASIWIFGIRHARKLSERDSVICVTVPVVAYILYVIYTMVVM
jgi:hypothetical protein